MRAVAFACVMLFGCAKAGVAGLDDSGTGSGSDASTDGTLIDAREIDAVPIDAPVMATLKEATSDTVVANTAIGCRNTSTGYSRLNSYYRIFTLTDFGIATKFHVAQVSFAVQQATAGGGAAQQAAQVKVGTYDVAPVGQTLDLTKVTPINSANIQIPNGSATVVNTPITGDIPAGTNLIVELALPDGLAAGNVFLIGSNNNGESKPGYFRAPDCQISSPTTSTSVAAGLGIATPNIILTVAGTH